ncbi:MAG: hypothetical protein DRH57_00100 [Candidatus Cloacimonadota bacterium]|nr:MAG: hypothetical protein DRH57_00100 [Candidatus Cloacimonadota bacterium]
MPVIKIEIKENGEVRIEGQNFWGEECREPIRQITDRLGIILEQEDLTETDCIISVSE